MKATTILLLFALGAILLGVSLFVMFYPYRPPCQEPTIVVPTETAVVPSGPERVIALATADLATRLSVDPKNVRLVSLEVVSWRDSCLEIYEPGVQCLQVITPGYRLWFQIEGSTEDWVYHTSDNSVRLKP